MASTVAESEAAVAATAALSTYVLLNSAEYVTRVCVSSHMQHVGDVGIRTFRLPTISMQRFLFFMSGSSGSRTGMVHSGQRVLPSLST